MGEPPKIWFYRFQLFSSGRSVEASQMASGEACGRDQVDAYVERFNKAVSIAFNMILGILAGVFLFYKTDDITTFPSIRLESLL